MNLYSWFKLEPGTGQYSKHFRLLTPCNNHVVFTRRFVHPYLGNHQSSEVFADHFFSFQFEDMAIESIEYDLKLGKIISSTPTILATQTLDNKDTTETQEMRFEVNLTEAHTSTFEYGVGFIISKGTTVKGSSTLSFSDRVRSY